MGVLNVLYEGRTDALLRAAKVLTESNGNGAATEPRDGEDLQRLVDLSARMGDDVSAHLARAWQLFFASRIADSQREGTALWPPSTAHGRPLR